MHTKSTLPKNQPTALELIATKTEARIDSRLLAQHLETQHESLLKLVTAHQGDFEELGKVRFQIGPSPDSRTGQSMKFALLNEDQAYLLLTYSRNTARVRALKIRLVKAFRDARLTADTRKVEYLPTYHRLHDDIHALASGSSNEHFVHLNINKLVNKAAGVQTGQRATASLAELSMLAVGQRLAANALHGATGYQDGYQRIKHVLQAFEAIAQPLQLDGDNHG
nr:Rha family transcriptional regulator [uncultured Acidovorax sp.]